MGGVEVKVLIRVDRGGAFHRAWRECLAASGSQAPARSRLDAEIRAVGSPRSRRFNGYCRHQRPNVFRVTSFRRMATTSVTCFLSNSLVNASVPERSFRSISCSCSGTTA